MNNESIDPRHGYWLEDLRVGMRAEYAKTFSTDDVVKFSQISGDDNPLHLDETFAAQTRFETPIIHGMLTTSLWSTIVGTLLPGPGCAYMSQQLNFYRPVSVGQRVSASLTVTEILADKQQALLDAEAYVGDTLVAGGETRVWVPSRLAKSN